MKRRLLAILLCISTFSGSLASAAGLLPTLTNTYGIAMPSLTEALHRYPESEETIDGAAVEHWAGVTEDDFNAFGVYLKKAGATLQDYRVDELMFTATVAKGGRTFGFVFDTGAETATATYPAGTYDERLFAVKSIWNAAESAEAAGQYTDAAEKYASLVRYEGASSCYLDSDQRELRCYYAEGEAKRAELKWDEAVAAFKKAGSYRDAAAQITETKYLQAKALLEMGSYAEALAAFENLKGYKDVDKLLTTDQNLVATAEAILAAAHEAKLKPFKTTGSYVTFGTYPQTSSGTDQTPIEWEVLEYDASNERSLIISRYGLDTKPYNTEDASTTWEQCTLRTWLNNDFMNEAFSSTEQQAILITTVDNSRKQVNSRWYDGSGNNTQDKVFVLSSAETVMYFGDSDITRHQMAPTPYAIEQGAFTNSKYKTTDGKLAGSWWLRSSSVWQSLFYYVKEVGIQGYHTTNRVNWSTVCVRPALWIDLKSDIFES